MGREGNGMIELLLQVQLSGDAMDFDQSARSTRALEMATGIHATIGKEIKSSSPALLLLGVARRRKQSAIGAAFFGSARGRPSWLPQGDPLCSVLHIAWIIGTPCRGLPRRMEVPSGIEPL